MSKTVEIVSPTGDAGLVTANYTKLSENIRRLTPQGIQCSVFCGGNNCKYENPENWTADSLALQGIYSHWITDNVLAMARPSTATILKKNVIQQFQSLGIKSIINLQCPREHASCGHPLEESGFSYEPNMFMENNIFYYNFAWKDYGDASLISLLNMVKVVAFAVTEGRVAVHCHAGLGRTGVLIACYLVYSLRVNPNDAIKYVRYKRPGSVQTRGQIVCVRHFAQSILPKTITFYIKDNINKDKYMSDFTLQRFLKRQKIILHGYDERNFRFIPKIVHAICERILQLCGCYTDEFHDSTDSITTNFLCTKLKLDADIPRHESLYSLSSNTDAVTPTSPQLPDFPQSSSCYSVSSVSISESEESDFKHFSDSNSDISTLDGDETEEQLINENKCFQELETRKISTVEAVPQKINDVQEVAVALIGKEVELTAQNKQALKQYESEINTSQKGWNRVKSETDLKLLVGLLYDWLETLKLPILGLSQLETVVINYKKTSNCFQKFDIEEACLIEYLLKFLSKIQPITKQDQDAILKRFIAAFTQQTVTIDDSTLPEGRGFRRLRDGTLRCLIEFIDNLFRLIYRHHNPESPKSSPSYETYKENTLEDFNTSDDENGFL